MSQQADGLSPAANQAELSQTTDLQIAEDVYEPCPCMQNYARNEPIATCWRCKGTGYQLTRRTLRPAQKPDFSEQAALAQVKTLEARLERGANTLTHAADLFLKLGHTKEAAVTRAAGQAMREGTTAEAVPLATPRPVRY